MPLKKTKHEAPFGVIYPLPKHTTGSDYPLSSTGLHTHHGFNYEYSLNRLLNVQQALAGLGYSLESHSQSVSGASHHGFWSFDTESAIRQFQSDRNMDVTGHLNHHTYNEILLAYEDVLDAGFLHTSEDDLGDEQDSEWHLEQARLDVMEAIVGEHSLSGLKSHLD